MLGARRRYQHAGPPRRHPLRHRPRLRGHRALDARLRADLGRARGSAYIPSGTRPRRSSIIALRVAAGVLYLAKEVLIPLALAILLSFMLAPAVRRLEQWKLPRLAATLIVALFAFAVVFGIAGVAASQAVSLGAQLPEYRQNIVKKIRALRHPKHDSNLGKAAEAIKDIEKEAAPERPPVPVKESPANAFEATAEYVAPVAKPL